MANIDSPKGFYPIEGSQRVHRYTVDVGNATAIYRGDLVIQEGDGAIAVATANAGDAVIGVAKGCYNSSGVAIPYLPATTVGYVDVYNDPEQVFGVQADTGTTLSIACVGATANHVAGTGSTSTGLSGHELDSSDVGTGQQLKIIGKVDTQGNDWGEHVDLKVLIVEHHYRNSTSV